MIYIALVVVIAPKGVIIEEANGRYEEFIIILCLTNSVMDSYV